MATNCSQLKMLSSDGKYYKTDVANTEQILRLIQSIPSKKAEPFKTVTHKIGQFSTTSNSLKSKIEGNELIQINPQLATF